MLTAATDQNACLRASCKTHLVKALHFDNVDNSMLPTYGMERIYHFKTVGKLRPGSLCALII